MRRGRIFIFLALIIILGVAAVFFLQRFLTDGGPVVVEGQPGEPAETQVVPKTEIVVVAQFVKAGTVLDETLLSMVEFPEESLLPGMFTDLESVVGRRVRIDLEAGTHLTASMLVDPEVGQLDGSDAALSIPPGMVAIPIPVDRLSSVAYALRPGDHVSVIASFMVVDVDTEFQSILPNTTAGVISTGKPSENEPTYLTVRIEPGGQSAFTGRTELDPLLNELIYVMPAEQQRARLVTQILMQDAIVLRYGEFSFLDLLPEDQQPQQQPAAGEGGEDDTNADSQQNQDGEETAPEAKPPDIVTLIVTPQEAVAIEHLLKSNVQFTLVLRANDDVNPIDTEAVTFQYLLETYNIPVPAKLPYGLEPRFDNPAPVIQETEGEQ